MSGFIKTLFKKRRPAELQAFLFFLPLTIFKVDDRIMKRNVRPFFPSTLLTSFLALLYLFFLIVCSDIKAYWGCEIKWLCWCKDLT